MAQVINYWEPPEHLAEWFKANPDGLHAEHPEHRKGAVVFDARGERVRGVRWISVRDARACVLVRDAEGFTVRDEDTGEELEEEVSAAGWSFRRTFNGATVKIGIAPGELESAIAP